MQYRAIENEDMRFIWAAYKKGALAPMNEKFADGQMSAEQFREEFQQYVIDHYHAAWMLFAPTKRGHVPVGIVFATWAPNAPFMIATGMCWFPWASTRNRLESMVNFLSKIRKEFMLTFYVLPEHKRLYEVCAMHGIVRRVGTSYTAFPGKPGAVFETDHRKHFSRMSEAA